MITGLAVDHPDTGPEADLYLEGHDQHRGWFHSSRLLANAIYGRAPYRGLLTHGFTVDNQGVLLVEEFRPAVIANRPSPPRTTIGVAHQTPNFPTGNCCPGFAPGDTGAT